jgi:3-oxoacyl-[acyl-carrier-protein] synthase-1
VRPLALVSTGVQCAVGLQAPAAFAAIRCGISGAAETDFVDSAGGPLLACSVPLERPVRGLERLVQLAASPISECLLDASGAKAEEIPLLLCVAEPTRPGRMEDLEGPLLERLQSKLGKKFDPRSATLPMGRVAFARAIEKAEALIHDGEAPYCLVAGADSMIRSSTLRVLDERGRILTERNSDGFIPGEAGSAILLARAARGKARELVCSGLGYGRETATIDGDAPLRADGMLAAFRAALKDAGTTTDDVDYRIADLSGEQYSFKEAALTAARGVRKVKTRFELWHPADCIGEVGAAAGGCILGLALTASRKGYAPGPGVLCQFGTDDGERAAVLLQERGGGA